MPERPSRSMALVVLSVGWVTLFAGLTVHAKVAAKGSVKIAQDFANRKLQIERTARRDKMIHVSSTNVRAHREGLPSRSIGWHRIGSNSGLAGPSHLTASILRLASAPDRF
jgi:hypothetical protein